MIETPTGTVGSGDKGNPDLNAAFAGGPTFMARLEQLGAARDRHDAALAALNLGHDTVAAHAAAQKSRSDAVDLQSRAQALLDTATKQAEQAKQQALMEAAQTRASAKADAEDLRLKAEKALEAALADADRLKEESDEDRRKAAAELSDAQAAKLEASRQCEAHGAALTKAQQREKDANAVYTKAMSGAAALRKVLDEWF